MSSSDLSDLLELQLSEIEMLQCMFPSENEFSLDDPSASAIIDVQKFVDEAADARGPGNSGIPVGLGAGAEHGRIRKTDTTSTTTSSKLCGLRQISFTVNINVTAGDSEEKYPSTELQLHCSLPTAYPNSLPEVNVQSNALSRQQYKELNEALKGHLQSLERGELCTTEAVQWLQENGPDYLSTPGHSDKQVDEKPTKSRGPTSFTRLWIHSHHIYSRSKREDIFAWANETGLTGFSLPGKPGVVCVEGPRGDVDEFWHKLRRLNWKKLSSKHREDVTLDENGEGSDSNFRHFKDFQEINFDVRGSRDYHMDLGQFFQYLEKHGCADVFKVLLGVDGRVSQKESS